MDSVNIYDAKTRLSQLRVAPKREIKFGVLKGKVHVAPDFDSPLPDAGRRFIEPTPSTAC